MVTSHRTFFLPKHPASKPLIFLALILFMNATALTCKVPAEIIAHCGQVSCTCTIITEKKEGVTVSHYNLEHGLRSRSLSTWPAVRRRASISSGNGRTVESDSGVGFCRTAALTSKPISCWCQNELSLAFSFSSPRWMSCLVK